MSLEPIFAGIHLTDAGSLLMAAVHMVRTAKASPLAPDVLDVAELGGPEDLGALGDFRKRYEPRRIVLCSGADASARSVWRIEGAAKALGWRVAVVAARDVVAEGRATESNASTRYAVDGVGELATLALACGMSSGQWWRHGDRDGKAVALLAALYAARNAV